MPATLDSDHLRRWAMQCEDQANDPRTSGYKRARFMKMRASLLALADEEDLSKRARRMPNTVSNPSEQLAGAQR
jgi:hypothetical protein